LRIKSLYIFFVIFFLLGIRADRGQVPKDLDSELKSQKDKVDARIENLKSQAEEFYKAFDAQDFNKFADMHHPVIYKDGGTRKEFLVMLKQTYDKNRQSFESSITSLGKPSELIELDKQLFGVIPKKLELVSFSKRKYITENSLVGISSDNGKTWKFVDGSEFDNVFPMYAGKLQIPKKKRFTDGKEY